MVNTTAYQSGHEQRSSNRKRQLRDSEGGSEGRGRLHLAKGGAHVVVPGPSTVECGDQLAQMQSLTAATCYSDESMMRS